jgi:pSer/pThr/pTyr-binding forkhead associated (FHA) protein
MKIVLVRFKGDERREFPLTRESTVVGRLPECALRIQTADVSRRHCEFTSAADGLSLRDLGSSNGTFVNGKRVAACKLAPGDQIAVGPVVFVVQIDGMPELIKPVKVSPRRVAPQPAAPAAETMTTTGEEEEQVFELTASDFDLEDAISALDELRQDEDDEEEDKGKAKGKKKR